jgi:ribose-phosphate pyrophosphokinase
MLFYTSSAEHIANAMKMKKGSFLLTKFSDGEIYSRVEEDVRGKAVWVLASTQPPADNILELAFLLDSLRRRGAKINLMILYFGYARQDRIVKEGEALSSKVVSDLLRKFRLSKVLVLHIHSSRVKKFLDFEDILPISLFSAVIRRMEVVAAPDKGALDLARKVSEDYGLDLAYMEKSRPRVEKVEITRLVGNVEGRKVVIVDDMISTGGTVIKAGQRLMRSGAKEVHVIATHGIFSGNAVKNLERSGIKSVHVTNSIKPNYKSRMIKTADVSKFVESLMSPVEVSRD